MKKIIVRCFALLCISFAACSHQEEAVRQENEMSQGIDTLSCGKSFPYSSLIQRVYLIDRLDALKKLHESSMVVFGRKFVVTQITSPQTPQGRYLLSPLEPPIHYFLMISVQTISPATPMGGEAHYLTIEKVCE